MLMNGTSTVNGETIPSTKGSFVILAIVKVSFLALP